MVREGSSAKGELRLEGRRGTEDLGSGGRAGTRSKMGRNLTMFTDSRKTTAKGNKTEVRRG